MFIEFFSATCADPNNLLVAISFLVGGDPSGSVEVQRAQEGPFTTVRVSSDIGNTVDLTDTMPDAFGWEYRIVAINSVGAGVTSAVVLVECSL